MSEGEKESIIRDAMECRKIRHHRPGREFEEPYFSFEVVADWGVYKDLQRHRILTRHRQMFTNELGYFTPEQLEHSPMLSDYKGAQEMAAEAYRTIAKDLPLEAQYLTTHGAYNRFYMKMNLREIVHLCELRSAKQGHPRYRWVAQEIAKAVTKKYPLLGKQVLKFVDYGDYDLERLDVFKKIQEKAKQKGVDVFRE